MEPNESGLSSYYHQQRHHHQPQPQPQPPHHHQSPTTVATTTSLTNGLLSNTHHGNAPTERTQTPMVFPHSVPSVVSSPLETVKRKRGRPRKYGTTSDQAPAPKKTVTSPSSSSPKKKDQALGGGAGSSSSVSSKKSQLVALGNAGQGFTPHVITVAAGEDMAQKIMLFMQQSKREICILSASGSISNASLRQPATSGGNITYEGRFDILSLSGSYVRTEIGGRTGGLSVCLSSGDGQIFGGGVGGPLVAAGPVQVIVGTFQIDTKKDVSAGVKGDASAGKLPSPVGGASVSSVGFRSAVESPGRIPIRGNDDHQNIGGSHFMIQPRGMHMTPSRSTDWRGGPDARISATYEMTGRTGHGARESPENGDYDQIPD